MKNNAELIQYLLKNKTLRSPHLIEAFQKIDRADFVLPEFKDSAYEDQPLPINYQQTISQPTTVAFMFELLGPQPGDCILDIGSGSAWTTTLLAQIVGARGKIIAKEIIPELVKFGQNNLAKYQFDNVNLAQAGEKIGEPTKTFDKILVSAASRELPPELLDQLKVGGRLVIPIKNSIHVIDKLTPDKINEQEYCGFVFVPLKT